MFYTKRLHITTFDLSMAKAVSELSLDEDNQRFLPDEVFETEKIAQEVIGDLIEAYDDGGPYVYPILLDGVNIGHVELIDLEDFFEVGYHIGVKYAGNGYATEALSGFLEYIKTERNIERVYGICLKENVKSIAVLKKCGFELEFEGLDEYQGEEAEIVRYVKVL